LIWSSRSAAAGIAITIAAAAIPAPLFAQQTERRWFVDQTASVNGDGSAAAPFATLSEAVKAARAGDAIVLRGGEKPYRGGIALKAGQSLIGEGELPAIVAAETDVVTIDGSDGEIAVRNLTIRASGAGRGLVVRNARGLVTIRDVVVSSDGAAAVVAEGASLDASFRSISARGEKLQHAISLTRTTGRFSVEGKSGERGSGGLIEGADARAISTIDAENVALRWMTVTGSASVNGTAPSNCGGSADVAACNAAVFLHNVRGATLEGMVLDTSGQAGVAAQAVHDLAIVSSEIRNAGDEVSEHGIVLRELTGTCRIEKTDVAKSASRHVMLHNSAGTLALIIDNSSFSDNPAPHGQQAVLISAASDAELELTVRDSKFARSFSHALEVLAADRAKVRMHVSGSTFDRNASAISIGLTQAANVDFAIVDNPSMTGSANNAINLYLGKPSLGRISGTIARNTIGRSGAAGSGAQCESCNGIAITAAGDGSIIADVRGNIVQQVGGSAISATAGQGGAQLELTVHGNLLREPAGEAAAIRVQSGTLPADAAGVCVDLGGAGANANTIEGTWEGSGAIHLLHRFGNARFRLTGLTGGNTDAAAAAFVGARNGNARVRAVLRDESKERGFEPAERCTMPAAPAP
jgi:hypothetical protein